MKKILTILTLTILLASCDDIFVIKEKKAIEVCQKAKVHLNAYSLGTNATWLDYANEIAKRNPNKKYDWHAKLTDDNKFYIVDFTDPNGWGHHWEVDIEQKIVKNINQNEYLSRKYGFTRLGGNDEFEITDVVKKELKIEKRYSYYDNSNSSTIVFVIKASVKNKTDKLITSASLSGKLRLIFQDKTITGESDYESGFKSRISQNNPWEPNTSREFYIKTKGIEKIYLNYVPEYVEFNISLKAEDPVGFSFDKDIADIDLIENWKTFKENPTGYPSKDNTKKSSLSSFKSNEDQMKELNENTEETDYENLDSNNDKQ